MRRRLFRWLFNLAAAVSLVLCAGTVVMWVSGYSHVIQWRRGGQQWMVIVGPRAADLVLNIPDWAETHDFSYWDMLRYHRWLGFRWVWSPRGQFGAWRMPLWLPLLVFTALPTAHVIHHRLRVHRALIGRCAACGYDLCATPERCPECGSIPSSSSSSAAAAAMK